MQGGQGNTMVILQIWQGADNAMTLTNWWKRLLDTWLLPWQRRNRKQRVKRERGEEKQGKQRVLDFFYIQYFNEEKKTTNNNIHCTKQGQICVHSKQLTDKEHWDACDYLTLLEVIAELMYNPCGQQLQSEAWITSFIYKIPLKANKYSMQMI